MKTLKEIYELLHTKDEEYNNYIERHRANVLKAFEEHYVPFMKVDSSFAPTKKEIDEIRNQIQNHDLSKYSEEEYQAYLHKFYSDGTISKEQIRNDFAFAWLDHIHKNPHHFQYWFLVNDTDHQDDRALDTPYKYIVEMLCDWGSFYFMNTEMKPGITPNSNASNWWLKHKEEFSRYMSKNTIDTIEEILSNCPEL